MGAVWVQSYTGKQLFLENPDPRSIALEDIAHHLSLISRFNGAIKEPYSVAEHSVHVANLVYGKTQNRAFGLIALLHDGCEAYLSDVSRPIKKLLPEYVRLEAQMKNCVYEAFQIPNALLLQAHEVVSWGDNVALATEVRDLLAHPPIDDWISHYDVQADPKVIVPVGHKRAKELFYETFSQMKSY